MSIEHNHPVSGISDYQPDCIRCRLQVNAEELLEAAEIVARNWPSKIDVINMQVIIDKIRGKKCI